MRYAGFAPVLLLTIAALVLAGGTLGYRYQSRIDVVSPKSETAESAPATEDLKREENTPDIVKKPVETKMTERDDLAAEFAILEREIGEVEQSGNFLSEAHFNRLMSDLDALSQSGFDPARVLALEERVAQHFIKDSPGAPAPSMEATLNCVSDPSPVFTNHITDLSKVDYIVPPPTMGTGPSLKTHSYIGTDHTRVPVYAPAALTLDNGSFFIDGPYLIEFRVSCEVKIRFGHITEPIAAIKNLFPSEPKSDSRTEALTPLTFAAGDLIAYTTGTNMAGNWDFGVYNSQVENRYIDNPDWNDSATYTSAVCPFDYFTPNLRSAYAAKFNATALGGNPPHGASFCTP
ncbi:hypothetical protein A3H77_01495 [Candidatus Kaiserbacteria bacterium RIFCSPLOWO2_02_FULL_56_11]|nr:MAG: hypothetical protein A3H77_01495 [Candidatus Kaiserbacteria bacterium RIFCSPLOWO2_02_FULL_56_11]